MGKAVQTGHRVEMWGVVVAAHFQMTCGSFSASVIIDG